MKEFSLAPYRILVDVEKNRNYYQKHPLPWVTCSCSGCRNFVQAVKELPSAVWDLFDALGLDPEKPAETCYYDMEQHGPVYFGGGWYHLTGKILEGKWPQDTWMEVTPGFSIAFQNECYLLPDDFPQPCFQMEVDFQLPWLLNEENPY